MRRLPFILFLMIVQPFFFLSAVGQSSYKPGAEVLVDTELQLLNGKRIGLVVNHTSMVRNRHLIDALQSENLLVKKLFAPEHGLRGNAAAGELIQDGKDKTSGLPVISLYGKNKKPDPKHIKGLDVILFDMQDVGVRPYTYVSTLFYVMETVLNMPDVELWVLDRGNPLGGKRVEGWILEEENKSFVGMFPVPMLHGLTIAEYARMMIGEQWINVQFPENLKVIAAENLTRSMTFADWNREWHSPSPNIPDFQTLQFYSGMVLVEGTNLSEGRGTDIPFRIIGAPGLRIDMEKLYDLCLDYEVEFQKVPFVPKEIDGKAMNPKFMNQKCVGYKFTYVGTPQRSNLLRFSFELLRLFKSENQFIEFSPFMHKLAGSEKAVSYMLGSHSKLDWDEEVSQFNRVRQKYLIYE